MTRQRTDAVACVLEVVALCKRRLPALEVTYEAGWEKRGNGLAAKYRGGTVHHTAFKPTAARPFPAQATLRDGRPDLDGPLCNFAGPYCTEERPRLHVVAAHPANHAGASGGKSMGPLPVTSLFNPLMLGLEIDYAGTSRMSAGQYLVATVWAGAVATATDSTVEVVRAHAETSITGKWDPGYALGKTIDMAAFRRDAALTLLEDLLPITTDDARKIANEILSADASGEEGVQPLRDVVSQLRSSSARLEAAVRSLPALVADAVGPAVAEALAGKVTVTVDTGAIATATADALAARLRA